MTQIARCDWLPERARWSHLARSGLPAVSHKKNFPESHIINLLYWPSLFGQDGWILASFFFASLWISTSSRSINTQQKNLANIQPFWPNKLGQYPIRNAPCQGSSLGSNLEEGMIAGYLTCDHTFLPWSQVSPVAVIVLWRGWFYIRLPSQNSVWTPTQAVYLLIIFPLLGIPISCPGHFQGVWLLVCFT